jgi:hypothetical protein
MEISRCFLVLRDSKTNKRHSLSILFLARGSSSSKLPSRQLRPNVTPEADSAWGRVPGSHVVSLINLVHPELLNTPSLTL